MISGILDEFFLDWFILWVGQLKHKLSLSSGNF